MRLQHLLDALEPSPRPIRNVFSEYALPRRPGRWLLAELAMSRCKIVRSLERVVGLPLGPRPGHVRDIFHDAVGRDDIRPFGDQRRIAFEFTRDMLPRMAGIENHQ